MSICSVSYPKTMHNSYIETELNFLQNKLETSVEALDKLLGNYNKELTNLTEIIQRDVYRDSQYQSLPPEEKIKQLINTPASNKVPPKPLPKPTNSKPNATINSNHDISEANRKPALRSKKQFIMCRMSQILTNISNRTAEHLVPDYKKLLQRSYTQLVNYISCTRDIAAQLYQNQMLSLPELDSIQKTRTMGNANENLLNALLQKPIEVYHAFLAELQSTHQSHVLSMLANADCDCFDCEAAGILHHSKLVRQHYVDLTEMLEVEESGLLNHLVAGNVLSERERADIATEWNKYRQAETLLAIIARKSSADYETFLQALVKTNQQHIYDILQGNRGSESSQKHQNTKICSKLHIQSGTNERANAKSKRRLQGSWTTGLTLPFSTRLDISIKILALHRKETTKIDPNVDNLLKGFVDLRKTAYSIETERLNIEEEKREALNKNSELTAENSHCERELRKVHRDAEWLRAELESRMSEIKKLKLQQTDAKLEIDRLESRLRDAEIANERLKKKLLDAANEIKRKRDLVLESDEYKQLQKDKGQMEQRLKETEKQLEFQKHSVTKNKKSNMNEPVLLLPSKNALKLRIEHLNIETDSQLEEFIRQTEEDKVKLEQFCNEIVQLKICVNQLENEKHQLLNDLNFERERNSQNKISRHIPRYHTSHVDRLEIGGSWVEGAAILDDKLYLACRGCSTLVVFSTPKPHNRLFSIQIPGMTGPIDIVACNTHRCLYVSDLGSTCVWQVKADYSSCKWLSNATWPYTLSVTDDGRILLVRRPSNLEIYGPGAKLFVSIRLPDVVLDPCHALETPQGTYLVSHGEKLSHQHAVTELTKEGRILRSYGGPLGQKPMELDRPRYLALDGYGNVLIADYGNNRIVMLDSELNFADILLRKEGDGIRNPLRIYFPDSRNVLVVSNGLVDFYSFSNSSKEWSNL